ncbi:MAG: threonine ammonia-lyase, biosynthetic [Gammaproteobacteria bacterium]|nr:threonine ammonia-lyase, biosynthetic [Gammaproteobacteria bacterium]
MERTVQKILQARVYEVAEQTPLTHAPILSSRFNNHIYLKREDLQPVFSFKLRGAYNKIAQLDADAKQQGIIAASAGNHAQGVALSAAKLGISATIVMPKTTPSIKIDSVSRYGAQTVIVGDSYDDAYQHAMTLAGDNQKMFIHPYDDIDVIAGQGTIGMELLRQKSGTIDAIFIPVGGGGLIAGITAYIKYVCPQVRIIGVEPDNAACMTRAIESGQRVIIDKVGLFADGVAVKQAGELPFQIARHLVDEMVCVNTDEICAAIKDNFDDTRAIAEPAGALAIAGLKRYVETKQVSHQHLIAINSGANTNFDRLRYIAERAELGEHKEALLAVTLPEKPGSFLDFCQLLGKHNITEFNYRYFDPDNASVFVGVSISDHINERRELVAQFNEAGLSALDMTDNELAKEHIRYMVGGHMPSSSNERIFSIEFPERPGALMDFLTALNGRWNISLFHYRNLGAAFGRVLLGIQISQQDTPAFQQCMDQLGYRYTEETDNSAYRLFAGYQ